MPSSAQRREEPGESSHHTDPAALAEAIRQTDAQLATATVVLQTVQDRLAVCAPREMADLQAKVEASQRRRVAIAERRALLVQRLAAAQQAEVEAARAAALQRVRDLDAQRRAVGADLDAALAVVRAKLDAWQTLSASLEDAWRAAGLTPRPRHREAFFLRSVLAVSLSETGLQPDKLAPAANFTQLAEVLSLAKEE